MKNISKIAFITLFTLGLVSCEEEQNLMFLTAPDAEFSIITPETGSSIVLTPELQNNPALTVTWNAVSYGTPTEVNYTVELAMNGTEFANPFEVSTTTSTNITWSVSELNAAVLNLGLAANTASAFDMRIKASVGSQADQPVYTAAITLQVTPFLTYMFTDLYLVGEAVASNWNNNDNNYPLYRDPANEDLYTYTGFFNSGGFKVLEEMGAWQPQWGLAGGVLASNPGTQDFDPDTFNAASAGYYTLTMNLNTLEQSFVPFTGSTATTYSNIGIIGEGIGGWDDANEINMTQSTFDPHVWYADNIAIAGEIKFRANNGWAVNWGANTEYTGTATLDGPNVPVAAANYRVFFYDLTAQYVLIPIQE